MLVALCVRGFKKCARNVSEVVTLFMGSKKYTHDRVWLLFESAGSKKYTRNNIGCSLCLWVQKNAPAIVLVAL